jgi:HEPN pEK499 p136
MSYPVGPLLGTLAERILANLDLVEKQAQTNAGSAPEGPPYSDTQLLISLLGVLVFPHARTPEALGKLLCEYGDLGRILKIRYPTGGARSIELTGLQGERECIDPTSIGGLPRVLRNGIAHFNVRPIDENNRFAGIRIWNEDESGRITLVADLDFAEFRPLARRILTALAEGKSNLKSDLRLDDPPDPLETLRRRATPSADPSARKAPRIKEHVWRQILAAHGGEHDRAQRFVDQVLQREVKRERDLRKINP